MVNSEQKNKYYAITASMTFAKTVLVPVEEVANIDEAIDLVERGVQLSSIDLLGDDEACDFEVSPSSYADVNGMYEKTQEEAKLYQIVKP